MDTFSDIIESFGVKPLAELLGVAESHVRTMKARGSIPIEYWPAIIARYPSLDFDRLVEMRASRKADRPFPVAGGRAKTEAAE